MAASTAMNSFKERLMEAAEDARVKPTPTAIGQSLGVAKQTVHRWFHTSEPSAAFLRLIEGKWNVSARWLATGKGEKAVSSESQQEVTIAHDKALQEIIGAWTMLNRAGRRLMTDTLEIAKEHFSVSKTSPDSGRGPDPKRRSNARSGNAHKRS